MTESTDKLFKMINQICSIASQNEYDKLALKETILNALKHNTSFKMSVKSRIFEEIGKINKRQLEVMGQDIEKPNVITGK
jgi:hypothetical protein